MIRNIFTLLVVILSSSLPAIAYSSTVTFWVVGHGARYPSGTAACKSLSSVADFIQETTTVGRCMLGYSFLAQVNSSTEMCPNGHGSDLKCNATLPTCPGGVTFNPDTNSCPAVDPNVARCAALANQQSNVVVTGNTNDPNSKVKQNGTKYTTNSREFSIGGCKVDIGLSTGGGGKCIFKADGIYACRFPVGYSGEVTPTGTPDDQQLPQDPEPSATSDSDSSCTEWAAQAGGSQKRECTSTSTAVQDGASSCERGNYNSECFKPSPVPESDTNTKHDEITETPQSDGGKKTVTKSTVTNVYCKEGACTTKTTVTTTTKTSDGSGTTVSENVTCAGPACPKPGGSGSGSGGGSGTGEGEGEGDGEFGSPGSGNFPDAADALPEIGEDGDLTYEESTQAYYDRIMDSPIVSSITNITVPGGGSCSVGSASLFGGSVSFNDFCTMAPQVLAGLRIIFICIWAWAAIRLFMTA